MNRSSQVVVAGFIWLFIVLFFVCFWVFLIHPWMKNHEEIAAKEEHKQILQKTSSDSRYNVELNFACDSFSGYSIFRSKEFVNQLGQKRIKLNLIDDKADYKSRIKTLQTGECQVAVFTLDALIKASSEIKDLPAVAIAIVDETRGADAMVAYKDTIANIDAMNNSEVKFVLTPDSPSETLSKVVISHFGLKNLNSNPFEAKTDASAVYKEYRNSKQTDNKVFVLWEPYVSKVLENPNMHVLVDSSRFRGYIVDVIVANRDFLAKNESIAQDFVESYLRASHGLEMKKIISEDAISLGEPLTEKQTERLVNGIWWKNTSENFAHFGLNNQPLQHIEDMIQNITKVLVSTNTIAEDPTGGKPNLLYYDRILYKLQSNNFHPGIEEIRNDNQDLPLLDEEEWKKLIPVGTLDVPTLVFARGTDNITEQSKANLDELVEKLKSWPFYYLTITGNASLQGDLEANKALAASRAKAAEQYLLSNGIGKNRVKVVSAEPNGSTSVVFRLGYVNY